MRALRNMRAIGAARAVTQAALASACGTILCVVPVRFIRVASRVLGANAAALLNNSTNILAGKAKLMVNPRLTWTTKFMVAKVDDPMRPFIMQDRQSVEHEIKDDKEDKEVKYMADARYNVGYGLWQTAVLTTFN